MVSGHGFPQSGSSSDSSGIWGMKSNPNTPSPPQYIPSTTPSTAPRLSSSAPAENHALFGLAVDEGIDVDDVTHTSPEEHGSRKRRVILTDIMYGCVYEIKFVHDSRSYTVVKTCTAILEPVHLLCTGVLNDTYAHITNNYDAPVQ